MDKKFIKKFFYSFIWLSPLVLITDFFTKLWVYKTFANVTVIPNFFYIRYTRNLGAAWGIFSEHTWLLAIISFLAGGGMIGYFIHQYQKLNAGNRASLMLMIGGTLGNFIDRAFYKEGVIDFLEFHFGSYIYPSFNIADSALVVGVILLFVLGYIIERPKPQQPKEEDRE